MTDSKLHEECGVFGIWTPGGSPLRPAQEAYAALFALQHRGQEACGIAVNRRGVIRCHKDLGLVGEVFSQEILNRLDDSIVRGTTSARLIRLVREAGASEVHLRVTAPPFRFPCFFGTDIPDQQQLIACGRTLEEMRTQIGADSLGFLSVKALQRIAKDCHMGLCDACFTGNYPMEVPKETQKNVFEQEIH